jgi:N-acetylmuramoyl-L-alanine amidase
MMTRRWGCVLALVAALLGGWPLAASAAGPGTVEIRTRTASLGRVTRVAGDGGSYVSAERLAAVLKGAWSAKGTRATLTVGKRSAQFVRNERRVVIQGQALTLGSPARVAARGWLIPDEFLDKGLPKLAPGVAAVSPEPPKAPASLPPRAAASLPPRPAASLTANTTAPAKPAASGLPKPAPLDAARAGGPAPGKPAARAATAGIALLELRHQSYPSFTRVVIESGAAVTYTMDTGPQDIRVRLPRLDLPGARTEAVADGLVKEIRLEPADGAAVLRVALESDAADVKAFSLQEPSRIVLDVFRRRETAASVPTARGLEPLRLIVLDAGHGGHDPGARGPTGLAEKDVALDVTRRVARMVEEGLGIKVALTRSTDVFVPLRERTSFANKQRADLFVSIHANAHPRAVSQGVETYFLSSEASDNDARQVAALENGVVQLESPASRPKGAMLKSILWDLAQSEFQHESSFMAETVLDSMTRSLNLVNRGIKQAGFFVLAGATMPAILIEIGFMTNPSEEKKLASPGHREAVARAIYAGLAEYKQRHDQRLSTVVVPVKSAR